MKNFMFYGLRILAAVALIGILSMIGVGNPKAVPILALFFVVVFGAIFLMNKSAQESQRTAKSGSGLMQVMKFVGLAVFIGMLSLLGLLHGPLGYIIWILVISLLFLAIFLRVKNHQRHSDLLPASPALKKIATLVLGILALLLPVLIIRYGGFVPIAAGKEILAIILTLVATLVFIGLIALALFMINIWGDKSGNRTLGYLLILLAAILPGIVVLLITRESMAFTGAYMAALLALILAFLALDNRYQLS